LIWGKKTTKAKKKSCKENDEKKAENNLEV